ncbi:MAG: hypothetical protein IPJ52_09450 [Rhodocyclaceae bacterium]|nr:hypothetical protein [Rhodocyclaceae bacterium]
MGYSTRLNLVAQNNGMDGDNWSANNVRTGGAGAIGWRMPRTDEAETILRNAIQNFGAFLTEADVANQY